MGGARKIVHKALKIVSFTSLFVTILLSIFKELKTGVSTTLDFVLISMALLLFHFSIRLYSALFGVRHTYENPQADFMRLIHAAVASCFTTHIIITDDVLPEPFKYGVLVVMGTFAAIYVLEGIQGSAGDRRYLGLCLTVNFLLQLALAGYTVKLGYIPGILALYIADLMYEDKHFIRGAVWINLFTSLYCCFASAMMQGKLHADD